MNLRVAEISDAGSAAELWRVVRGYFRARGFRGFAYFMTSRSGPGPRRGFNIVHRGFSRAVEQAYVSEGWGEKDPLPQVVISRGAPTRWSSAWALIEPDDEQMAFLARMRAAELGDGFTLPVYGPAGRNGSVNVGATVRENVLDTAPVEEMHMVAQVAHMRLCQLLPDRGPLEKPLSARELEILDWVARGKSNSVIAEILDLSGATVDTYLRRIYEKLEVSDRTSAAVVGVGMGLIAA
ncbi:LuxR C-terminal-related transcriptional regulator [Sphingobium sp. DEHP117]|uniref:helix-turn-helix transcriptional regulator n=1 Tax=Sphingobium sp. DEHP117 TaxID=2993436 RepID=UPI0027D48BC1|nr:LuxR C-terminal-related transcriptional regulator [Sphingobium sp. DEHP117]MDQ4420551.1 LuxR C-terminal-related transcriptional regulator [Sphingobium sp. DEHP117]